MSRSLAVVKVGGSLYDLPDLGPRLRAWLEQAPADDFLFVPGGGPTADVIRNLDRIHHLGEEKAHWLALEGLRVNAFFLASLLPSARLIERPGQTKAAGPAILNPSAFLAWQDAASPEGRLPHIWAVTSDSVAARAAVSFGADHLFLLKSVTIPEGMDWEQAAEKGFVDEWFARTIRPGGPRLQVHAVNFREWRP